MDVEQYAREHGLSVAAAALEMSKGTKKPAAEPKAAGPKPGKGPKSKELK